LFQTSWAALGAPGGSSPGGRAATALHHPFNIKRWNVTPERQSPPLTQATRQSEVPVRPLCELGMCVPKLQGVLMPCNAIPPKVCFCVGSLCLMHGKGARLASLCVTFLAPPPVASPRGGVHCAHACICQSQIGFHWPGSSTCHMHTLNLCLVTCHFLAFIEVTLVAPTAPRQRQGTA